MILNSKKYNIDKVLFDRNNLLLVNNNKELIDLENKIVFSNAYFSNSNKYLYKHFEDVLYIKFNGSFEKFDKGFLGGCLISNKDFFLSFDVLIEELKTTYHFKEDTIESFFKLEGFNVPISFLSRDILFTDKKKNIFRYSIQSAESLWSYELPEGYKIHKSIQLVENVLFFEAYKGTNDYNKVLGIDVKTGNILWEYNFQVPYNEQIVAFVVNPNNKLSYGYFGSLYQIFNPITGEMLLEKDMSSYYEQGISPDKNAIYDNKLWFVSGKGENVKFGAINLETSEVEFVQDFPLNTAEQNDEHFDTPVYHNGKLYLRGVHYNTLYIFENEDYKSEEK